MSLKSIHNNRLILPFQCKHISILLWLQFREYIERNNEMLHQLQWSECTSDHGRALFAELTEEMFGNPQSVLNRFTRERFCSLMQQVKHPNINTKERLNGAIDLMVEQVMSEPASCATYANMCRELVWVSSSHPSWMCSKQLPDATIYPYSNRGAGGLVKLQATLEWEGGVTIQHRS